MSTCKPKKVTFDITKNEYFYIPKKITKNPVLVSEAINFCPKKSSRGQLKKQGTTLESENGKKIFINHNGLFM